MGVLRFRHCDLLIEPGLGTLHEQVAGASMGQDPRLLWMGYENKIIRFRFVSRHTPETLTVVRLDEVPNWLAQATV